MVALLLELGKVPLWFVLAMIFYLFWVTMIGGYRWALLLLDRPSFRDVLFFTRSIYLGGFYGLFLPSSVGMDLTKWLPLIKRYPQFSKVKLVGSVVVDRLIGFSAFVFVAFVSLVVGKLLNFSFPPYLLWLFLGLFLGLVLFYFLLFAFDLTSLVGRIPFLRRYSDLVGFLESENMSRIVQCLFVALCSELAWMVQTYFYSLIFGAGFNLVSVFVFVPIIYLVLVLPISFAGFGARETMFLYFFSQVGATPEKILLVSTFSGIVGVVSYLLGGVWSLF